MHNVLNECDLGEKKNPDGWEWNKNVQKETNNLLGEPRRYENVTGIQKNLLVLSICYKSIHGKEWFQIPDWFVYDGSFRELVEDARAMRDCKCGIGCFSVLLRLDLQ